MYVCMFELLWQLSNFVLTPSTAWLLCSLLKTPYNYEPKWAHRTICMMEKYSEKDFKPSFKELMSFMGTAFTQGHSREHRFRCNSDQKTVTPLTDKSTAPVEPACEFHWKLPAHCHKWCTLYKKPQGPGVTLITIAHNPWYQCLFSHDRSYLTCAVIDIS